MKKLLLLGLALVLTAVVSGCDGDDDDVVVVVSGPGLVGIDDSTANAPLLIVNYTVPPSTTVLTANILSDLQSDGDIAFDVVLNSFTVTPASSLTFPVVLFGFDSADPNLPEFRGFLTFPLDGATGMDNVPGTAVIVSATLDLVVNQVSFASVIPTFLDLIQYPFRGLSAAAFNAPLVSPTSFRTLNFFSNDVEVLIDVTGLMQVAQGPPALPDFQVRFLVDSGGTLAASRGPAEKAARSAYTTPRVTDNVLPSRRTQPLAPAEPIDPASRRR